MFSISTLRLRVFFDDNATDHHIQLAKGWIERFNEETLRIYGVEGRTTYILNLLTYIFDDKIRFGAAYNFTAAPRIF